MTQGNSSGASRHRRALTSCALALLWLALLTIGALAAGKAPTAQAHGAGASGTQSIAWPGGPRGTDTPTDTPTATATRTRPVTPTAEITSTVAPTRAPTQAPFTPGPQPTRVTFSQPTVGASARFDSPGIAGAPDGPNGMVIATIASCITAVLAIITTVIAFSVLRRGGYAPFLRLLLLGGKRGQARRGASRARRGGRRNLGATDDEISRPYARGAGGRYRDGSW